MGGMEGWVVAGFQGFWFFSGAQCTLILDKQSKGVGGWDGGEGRGGEGRGGEGRGGEGGVDGGWISGLLVFF